VSKSGCLVHLVRAKSAKPTNRFYPNLALPTLASVLRDKCKVEIHDLGQSERAKYIEHVQNTKPKAIGFTSFIDDFGDVLSLASECKNVSENSFIIVGGPHVSVLGGSNATISKFIDFAVIGEGENTICKLIQMLSDYGNPQKTGQTHVVWSESFYNLESALPPAWDLYDRTPFFPVLPVETARGCPYLCKYCGEGWMYGKKVRAKNIEQVVRELKINVEEMDVRFFRFTDSVLNFSKKRFLELCRAFIDSKLEIRWSAYARFETIEPSFLAIAKESGCASLFFGIESGSENILKNVRKKLTSTDHMRKVISTAKDIGLHTHCNFIVGFPDESIHSVGESMRLIRDISPDSVHISTFFVVPQTDMHINSEKYGIQFLDPNWIKNQHLFFGDSTYSYFRHRTMTQDDIRMYYSIMRNEIEQIESIYWNMKDHVLLTWLSAGGSETGLKRIWRKPEQYLNAYELKHFEAFKEKDIRRVDDEQNSKKVITELALRFR